MLKAGRNLAQIKAELARQTQQTLQAMAACGQSALDDLAQAPITSWSFGALPEIMEISRRGQTVIGYPALVDEGSDCRIDVFDEPHVARAHHRDGLVRLLRIALKDQVRFVEKNLPEALRLGVLFMPLGTWEQLRTDLVSAALYQSCLTGQWPQSASEFEACQALARERFGLLAQELARLVLEILQAHSEVQKRLTQFKIHAHACQDIKAQLAQLLPKSFVVQTPYEQLRHYPRYLQAIVVRFDGLRADAVRDQSKTREMAPLLANYQRARTALAGAPDPALDEYGWMLQELRVALYAQRLRTPYPVSVKRLMKAWQALGR
jgi:ATP-dependent helicase HrpA